MWGTTRMLPHARTGCSETQTHVNYHPSSFILTCPISPHVRGTIYYHLKLSIENCLKVRVSLATSPALRPFASSVRQCFFYFFCCESYLRLFSTS